MLNIDISLTILLLIIFIGIIVWAWSPGRKQDFNEAAQLVVDDDTDNIEIETMTEGRKHG